MKTEQLLESLRAAQRDIEDSVFRSPPTDWTEFQRRLGLWLGYEAAGNLVQVELAKERKAEDNDED